MPDDHGARRIIREFFDLSNSIEEQETTTVTARVNVPFYQGGAVAARLRQAKEVNNQRKKEVEDARLRSPCRCGVLLGHLQSSTTQIEAAKAAVEANRIALEGVREEEKVGQRTTLDVLNAQLEFLDSQIQLVDALRDPDFRRIFALLPLSAGWMHKVLACQCLITIRSSTMTS